MGPRFGVLATDYDGTLARHGKVEATTLGALERLRASGRHTFLVTGRELEDLKLVFTRLDLFDVVAAENGALLYYPSVDQIHLLHRPAPSSFLDELRAQDVKPLSVGRVIVASQEPNEKRMLDIIKKLGLELEIIFNKGSVMVLPSGVNKATGLARALGDLGLRPERTVGVGDAENDHAFLKLCGFAVAVSNAVPALKQAADLVTQASHGDGVAELVDLMVRTDLEEVAGLRVQSDQHPRVLSGLDTNSRKTP